MEERKFLSNLDISELGISVRAYNCLSRAGIKTVGDIAEKTFRDLLLVRNIGNRVAFETLVCLYDYGLRVKDFPKDKYDTIESFIVENYPNLIERIKRWSNSSFGYLSNREFNFPLTFSDIIRELLKAKNFDENELARELCCTPEQIRNLRDGVSKLPNSDTCKKILRYCDKNSLDFGTIDWNYIVKRLIAENEWLDDYVLIEELDSDNYVLLEHEACGRRTKVPFSTLNRKSLPCIHCWVEKYVPLDAYKTDLSEYTTEYTFTHTCGNSYYVSYEQIKQKKYKCPDCGAKHNADEQVVNLKRDYSFINQPKLPQYWMDYDYFKRYFQKYARNKEMVWIESSVLNVFGSHILCKAVTDVEITEDLIEKITVYYSKFELEKYLYYCLWDEGEKIEVDFNDYPNDKNVLFIVANLTNGEQINLMYLTQDMILHNKSGFVIRGTEGKSDDVLRYIKRNARFYEKLPDVDLENMQYHINLNKTTQSLYELYKSFSDSIELEEILPKIEGQIALLQYKLKTMEALQALNNYVESVVSPKPVDTDFEEDYSFDDEDVDIDSIDFNGFDDEEEIDIDSIDWGDFDDEED